MIITPNKEKAIQGLRACAVEYDCKKCPYHASNDSYDSCVRHLMRNALVVLMGSEQQSVEPTPKA